MSALLQQTTALIQQDFQLEELPSFAEEAALLNFLTELVEELLERNLERLFWVLYRLDIGEEKAHAALSLKAKDPAAPALAALILTREKQKAQSRLDYQQDATEEDVTLW
ncbi:MAG: hypothetical protein ACRBFS_12870 [Aureispira sp.]